MLKLLTSTSNVNLRHCSLPSHLSTALNAYNSVPLLALFFLSITPSAWTSSCKKVGKNTKMLLCGGFFLFVLLLLTWRSRFTFTVMSRTGGLRVQAKSAGYRRKFIAELLHVIRDHWPRLPTTVSHCIPVVMLQNVTSLFSFGY